MFKRKHKNVPLKPPKRLWHKKSFEFVVPQPLEACCSYFEQLDQALFSSYSVYLSSIDQKQISFNICKSEGRLGSVWALGNLQAIETNSTRIIGKVGIPALALVFRACLLGVIAFIFGFNEYLSRGLEAAMAYGIVFGLIWLLTWGWLMLTREVLIDKLRPWNFTLQ